MKNFITIFMVFTICITLTLSESLNKVKSDAIANSSSQSDQDLSQRHKSSSEKSNELSESVRMLNSLGEYYQVGKLLLKQTGLLKGDGASVRGLLGLPLTAIVYVVSMLIGVIVMMAFYESPLSPLPVPPLPHPPVGRFPPEHPIWPPPQRSSSYQNYNTKNHYSRSDLDPAIQQIINSVRNQQLNQFSKRTVPHQAEASAPKPQYVSLPLKQQKPQQQPQMQSQQSLHHQYQPSPEVMHKIQLQQQQQQQQQQQYQQQSSQLRQPQERQQPEQQTSQQQTTPVATLSKQWERVQPDSLITGMILEETRSKPDEESSGNHSSSSVSNYELNRNHGDQIDVDNEEKRENANSNQDEHQLMKQRLKQQQQLLQQQFNSHQQLFARQQKAQQTQQLPVVRD